MLNLFRRLWNEDEGQGMVEYGLIIALVAIAAVVVLTSMGGEIDATFQSIQDTLSEAIGSGS